LWIAAVAKLRRWTEIVLPVKDETWVEQKRLCGKCRGENDIHISLESLGCGVVNNNNVFTTLLLLLLLLSSSSSSLS